MLRYPNIRLLVLCRIADGTSCSDAVITMAAEYGLPDQPSEPVQAPSHRECGAINSALSIVTTSLQQQEADARAINDACSKLVQDVENYKSSACLIDCTRPVQVRASCCLIAPIVMDFLLQQLCTA